MKRLLLIACLFLFAKPLLAEHITGGEMFYTYLGVENGQHVYKVTLKLFRNCGNVGAQLDQTAAIGLFGNQDQALIRVKMFELGENPETLELTNPGPCITNAPTVCYQVGYYTDTFHLSATLRGYTFAYQRCCRINGINNLLNSGNAGATYTAEIPGTQVLASGPVNNSAQFNGKDTVVVCGGYPFTYSFGAVDPDATDRLTYTFCGAYLGGSGGANGQAAPNPPAEPPYTAVTYSFPYSAGSPMGPTVTIDPNTGLISGTSPEEGIYVVTVCVSEIRNGVVIATQRKDIQIKAGGCRLAKPSLKPDYITCDGLSFSFTHPDNSLINTYSWEFGDPSTGVNDFSSLQNPTHVFSAPGEYTIKLVANRGQECSDSATAIVKVYPGFFPNFNFSGVCITNPVLFQDATTTNFGVVNNWNWNFGETGTNNTSTDQNPSHSFGSAGPKIVTLIVGSDLGCIDTLTQTLEIITKPPITLGFPDTLICRSDAVQLEASGTGTFSWTPTTNIVSPNSANPVVSPPTTTTYYVELNEQGCVNIDSVKINVVDFVTLYALGDPTTICLTDSVQLRVTSDALHYQWSPAATLNDATLANPMANPTATTTYTVTGTIGSCTATDDVTIITVPYPVAQAGPDTAICYNSPAQLHGSHNGSTFSWTPTGSLSNPNSLNPIATPVFTTTYILRSFDTQGCDKPGSDTVVVTVSPRIRPYAGRDTLVVIGQSLQLNAEGGVSYLWSPSTGLNNPAIANPIGVYDGDVDSIRYTVKVFNEIGCVDSAFVTVVVFKTNPYVFVPTGFTPNNDGVNDILAPVAVGVERINYFRVFNRWGQLVFQTSVNGYGWDGRLGGIPQATNVFVWMVSARDYTGKTIFLKGTSTLIR